MAGEGHKAAKLRVKQQKVAGVAKVIGVSKLKGKYEPYEAKRQLCNSYDLFIADDRVVPSLPKLIGPRHAVTILCLAHRSLFESHKCLSHIWRMYAWNPFCAVCLGPLLCFCAFTMFIYKFLVCLSENALYARCKWLCTLVVIGVHLVAWQH